MKAAARARGRGHRRSRHGQSRRRAAAACHRQARRGRARSPTPTAIRRRRAFRACARRRPAYYARRFGVEVDPDSEVVVTLGSKEGLANLAQAITAPGDVVLAPNPSYPIHTFGFIIAGAAIRSIPAAPGPDFFEQLEHAMRYTVPRPTVLVIGYPSNPTAYDGRPRLLRAGRRLRPRARPVGDQRPRLCRNLFRRRADAVDPAGAGREGRRDRVHLACRKTYSMAGWRIGFAVGNRAADRGADAGQILSRLWRLHADPGGGGRRAQRPAGLIAANREPLQGAPRRAGRELRPRRLGDSRRPRASMFAWAPIPPALRATSARSNSPSSC